MGLANVHCGATPPSVMVLLGMRYLVKVLIQRGGEADDLGLRTSPQWEQVFVR